MAKYAFVPLAVTHGHVLFNVAAFHSLTRTFRQADVFEELHTNNRLKQGNTSLAAVRLTIRLMESAGNTHFPYDIFMLNTTNCCF